MAKKSTPPDAGTQTKSTSPDAGSDFGAKLHYEEWECKISQTKDGPQAEKLKLVRDNVKITEEQANLLNEGMLNGGNSYAKLYYLPE